MVVSERLSAITAKLSREGATPTDHDLLTTNWLATKRRGYSPSSAVVVSYSDMDEVEAMMRAEPGNEQQASKNNERSQEEKRRWWVDKTKDRMRQIMKQIQREKKRKHDPAAAGEIISLTNELEGLVEKLKITATEKELKDIRNQGLIERAKDYISSL